MKDRIKIKDKPPLYAVTEGDGTIRSLHIGREKAVAELKRHIEDGQEGGIRRISSLQDFINEYANFEDPASDPKNACLRRIINKIDKAIAAEEAKNE